MRRFLLGKWLSQCLHAVKDQFARSQREEGESSLAFTRGADRRDPQPYTRRSWGSVHHANHAFLTFLPVRPPVLHFLEHLYHLEAWGILYDVLWRLTCNCVVSVSSGGKLTWNTHCFSCTQYLCMIYTLSECFLMVSGRQHLVHVNKKKKWINMGN